MPETPDEWRDHLLRKIDARAPSIAKLHRYYDGDHDKPPLPSDCSRDMKELREHCTLNLCSLVVDAPIERLAVQGFQFGEEAKDALDVWHKIWQANRLDADSDLVHMEALIARRAFVLVWPTDDGIEITPESPSECLVEYAPGSRRKRIAAIKRFTTGGDPNTVSLDKKTTDVTIWLPGEVYRWTRKGGGPWVAVEESTGPAPSALGETIPMVEFLSNPDLAGNPHSELDRAVIDIQDRINKTIYDRLVLTEFQAFPQRWALGISVETDSNGIAQRPIKTGPNRQFVDENENAKLGQWDAADLSPHLKAVEADIHGIAAVTKTPVYYLAASFSNISADAIRAAEAGLIKKVNRHQRVFGESWEEVIRLALKITGDARANDMSSVIEWADPETRTRAEEADAAIKLDTILPRAETWNRLGYSPQDRARFEQDMAQEALNARLAAPAATPVPVGA